MVYPSNIPRIGHHPQIIHKPHVEDVIAQKIAQDIVVPDQRNVVIADSPKEVHYVQPSPEVSLRLPEIHVQAPSHIIERPPKGYPTVEVENPHEVHSTLPTTEIIEKP